MTIEKTILFATALAPCTVCRLPAVGKLCKFFMLVAMSFLRTIKKHPLLTGGIVLACTALVVFFIHMGSEDDYGETYAEQQRFLFNTWLYESGKEKSNDSDTCINHIRQLQADSAPDWAVTITPEPVLPDLPLEGLTWNELRQRAQWDADTCLQLLKFCKEDFTMLDGYFLTRARRHILAAVQLNRPGADFLLKLVDKAKEAYPAKINITEIEGYKEFEQLIRQGDYRLYQALAYIFEADYYKYFLYAVEQSAQSPSFHNGLSRERILGEFFFSQYTDSTDLQEAINTEIIECQDTPSKSFFKKITFYISGWFALESSSKAYSETQKHAEIASQYLREAAKQGDLHAMSLWMTKWVPLLNYCDRETWDDILLFTDTLLEKGNADFLYFILKTWEFREDPTAYAPMIPVIFYSMPSVEKRYADISTALLKRGDLRILQHLLVFKMSSFGVDSIYLCLQDQDGMHSLSSFLPENFILIPNVYLALLKERDQTLRYRLIAAIRKEAESGNPRAMLALADLVNSSVEKERYKGELHDLLNKIPQTVEKNNNDRIIIFDEEGNSQPIAFNKPLTVKIHAEKTLFRYYLNGNLDKQNAQKAFQIAESIYNDQSIEDFPQKFYYMGIVHERGIGTAQNLSLAIQYYLEGMRAKSDECEQALNDLYKKSWGILEILNRPATKKTK